ncbi:hypothetical protein HBI56_172860 [Parastagonospora nodorum]|uniref:Uncharacterized protein n=1 Tax=Phaeosphaeria nodorum (strain SN15 / ATCC MYA-4574 / FGSC 10173) TaxID=321614 RepID=A0A7U2F1U0_PHANO|nr:hypothetical protein HBH56_221700 [Parastagonospora nodorum]QRC97181.1 hypothetical protein JI435_139430 [Parastagonospora nodorum SN15]KAH3924099.1 hypothetical protein HBH54_200050 [Parastagonospora nodorum]KAH3944655.1 hypothetical protein HBH53_156420 [Parastagonospora nodorum]KAH3995012.1 hypothetical protein HBI10_176820 [Parastagonospora nodorum]
MQPLLWRVHRYYTRHVFEAFNIVRDSCLYSYSLQAHSAMAGCWCPSLSGRVRIVRSGQGPRPIADSC